MEKKLKLRASRDHQYWNWQPRSEGNKIKLFFFDTYDSLLMNNSRYMNNLLKIAKLQDGPKARISEVLPPYKAAATDL